MTDDPPKVRSVAPDVARCESHAIMFRGTVEEYKTHLTRLLCFVMNQARRPPGCTGTGKGVG